MSLQRSATIRVALGDKKAWERTSGPSAKRTSSWIVEGQLGRNVWHWKRLTRYSGLKAQPTTSLRLLWTACNRFRSSDLLSYEQPPLHVNALSDPAPSGIDQALQKGDVVLRSFCCRRKTLVGVRLQEGVHFEQGPYHQEERTTLSTPTIFSLFLPGTPRDTQTYHTKRRPKCLVSCLQYLQAQAVPNMNYSTTD